MNDFDLDPAVLAAMKEISRRPETADRIAAILDKKPPS